MPACSPPVAILLSTYEGERFLVPQLHSLLSQTHRDWILYWRDDGSSDGSRQVMRDFLGRLSPDRAVVLDENVRVGATESYMRLLRRAYADGQPLMAFADQDDVWLPEKLARGVTELAAVPEETPALYFARQVLVDARLRRIAMSYRVRRPPGFPAALTQNLATGCTVLMNRAAMGLLATSTAPMGSLHDWWSYIMVSAHGGRLIADDEPTVLYRQHDTNTVGAPPQPVAARDRGAAARSGAVYAAAARLCRDAVRPGRPTRSFGTRATGSYCFRAGGGTVPAFVGAGHAGVPAADGAGDIVVSDLVFVEVSLGLASGQRLLPHVSRGVRRGR